MWRDVCVLDDIIENQRWLRSTSVRQQCPPTYFPSNLFYNDPKFQTLSSSTTSFSPLTLLSLLELYVFNLSANEEHSCMCVYVSVCVHVCVCVC